MTVAAILLLQKVLEDQRKAIEKGSKEVKAQKYKERKDVCNPANRSSL